MFTASDVKNLREKTGAGMMDCKKALEACEGSIDKAIDWLREKGIAKAAKKADRIAAEGLTRIFINGNKAVVLEVNSETDFVAKNEKFTNFLDTIGNAILASDVTTMDEALALNTENGTINDLVVAITATIGEKISFRRFIVVNKNDDEVFGSYLHMGGKISSLITIAGNDEAMAKQVAMHAAAMRPLYLNESAVPTDVLDHEKEMMKTELINEGKPADKVDMILPGKVKKYYEEVCLENQIYVMSENKETVGNFLKNNGSKLVNMVRYEVGEGLEKRQENFAEEVAKQLKANGVPEDQIIIKWYGDTVQPREGIQNRVVIISGK